MGCQELMDSHRLAEWNLMSCSSCCRLFQKWQGLPWHEWLSRTGGRSTDSVLPIYCFIQAASKTKWKLCSRLCVQQRKWTANKTTHLSVFKPSSRQSRTTVGADFGRLLLSSIRLTFVTQHLLTMHTAHTHTRVVCLLLPPLCFNYCRYRK